MGLTLNTATIYNFEGLFCFLGIVTILNWDVLAFQYDKKFSGSRLCTIYCYFFYCQSGISFRLRPGVCGHSVTNKPTKKLAFHLRSI